ncbi:MAG: hypothetical protein K940chlam1_00977 [Candidatus Anoxychlamydiales bacterium]|nr:hypothetical protein [Candidatus Anoxychlamydiales bacterium]NGX36125.1 hypothetical protein [Candidatus Anoxychlamydiales bacterium]
MKLIAELGPLKGLVLNLEEKDEWILGRDPDQSTFVLEDTTVSRKHAKIYKTEEGYVIKNLSTTNPIEVNDERVDEYILEEGDKIKLGDSIFLFTALSEEDLEEEPEEQEEKIEEELKEPKEEIIEEKVSKKSLEDLDETIFEESEEEMPVPLVIESPFILKVVSGPNAGSEFGMEKSKSYIIGKDSTLSDIIFADLSVSKQNTKITIDENQNIFIEDLGSKNGTYVNNKQIKEKTPVSSNDLITLGTTTFLIVEREAAQETIYSPAPSFEFEEEKEKEEKQKKETVWKKQFIPTRHLILAGSGLVIFFVIFLSFFALFKAKDIEIVKKEPTSEIENILKNYKDVEFSFNPSGANLFLVGHVSTMIDKQELMYDINNLNFIKNVEDNIVIDEYVIKDFNEVLNEEEDFRSVYTYSNKAGNFIVEGYVKTPTNYQNLTDYINTNFPYLDKLQNKVIIDQVLQIQIATKLAQKDLSGVTYVLTAGKLVLAGTFDKSKTKAFNELLEEFKKTPGIYSIKNLAIGSSETDARIDLSNKYKITGWAKYDGTNFSVVANGKIITVGELLDGMIVTGVSEKAVLLKKGDLKYKINYSP